MEREKLLDKTALTVSRILHPLLISVPLGIVFLYLAEVSLLESIKWVSISAAITVLPISLFLWRHPDYEIREVNNRERRDLLYLIGIIQFSCVVAVSRLLKAPEIVQLSSIVLLTLGLIGGLINRFTKVSLHVGILSGFSAAISFMSPSIGSLSSLITLIAGWSRLRLGRHSLKQVTLGLLIPPAVILAVFSLLL